jgi:hypothetical protein
MFGIAEMVNVAGDVAPVAVAVTVIVPVAVAASCTVLVVLPLASVVVVGLPSTADPAGETDHVTVWPDSPVPALLCT